MFNNYFDRTTAIRFSLSDLLAFVTAIPFCVGAVAAIKFAACTTSYTWFGVAWYSAVREFLIYDVGMSASFVCGYVTFAMLDVPAWICYFAIASILGLIRSNWTYIIGIAFIAAILLCDFASNFFSGIYSNINLRLVSLFGAFGTATCFTIARKIRGNAFVSKRKVSRMRRVLTYLAIAVSLAVSVFGWWLIDVDRKAGLEAQKIIGNFQ
jgi:hypothetical protein